MPWSVGNSSFYESVIQAIAERYEIDLDTPWQRAARASSRTCFLYGTERRAGLRPVPQPDGPPALVHARVRGDRRRASSAATARPTRAQQRERIEEYMTLPALPGLQGRAAEARGARGHGRRAEHPRVHAACRCTRALEFLDELELTETEQLIGARIVKEIRERLTFLDNVGVGYLQLDRAAATLSGGEAQRLRLATQIGSQLVGVLYILDEPSIGLHQRDNGKLIGTLERLRDLGNTVLVVEHDEQMMRAADWLVDMGPGAGEHGGHVVAEGTADEGRARTRSRSPASSSRASARSRCRERRDERRRLVLRSAARRSTT